MKQLAFDFRAVPEHVSAAAVRAVARLGVDITEAHFDGRWGAVEHLCHEIGHILFEERPLERGSVAAIGQSHIGEAYAWAIAGQIMALLGIPTFSHRSAAFGCEFQGVSAHLYDKARADARVPNLAAEAAALILGCASDPEPDEWWPARGATVEPVFADGAAVGWRI